MTEEQSTAHRCACLSEDEYACWAFRYGAGFYVSGHDDGRIEEDGGPCECSCHEDDDEDGYNGGW